MARKTYSARQFAGGFQPVQLSTGEITRMTEESNRVINNMERLRKVELQRGLEYLQQMKENSAFEQKQRERNHRIILENAQANGLELQFEQKRIAQEAQAAARNSRYEAAAASSSTSTGAGGNNLQDILSGISDFSQAAAGLKQKIEVEQEKNRQFFETLSYMGLSEGEQLDPAFQAMEDGLRISGMRYAQTISLAEANQGDPNAIARSREANPANKYASKKSAANWMLMNIFEGYLNNLLNDTSTTFNYNGQSVTFASARSNPRLMSAVQRFAFKKFVNENGLTLDRRFIKDGLNHVQKLFTANESRASQIEIKNSYARQEQVATNTLSNNPGAVRENLPTVFNTLKDIPTVGYAGAWDKVVQLLGTTLDVDGNTKFKYEEFSQWDGFKGHENRLQEIRDLQSKAVEKFATQQLNTESIALKTDVNSLLQYFSVPENRTQANMVAAANGLDEKYYLGAGDSIRRRIPMDSLEAVNKINLVKQFDSIPSELLTREHELAASRIDSELAARISKRRQAQDDIKNNPEYKITNKNIGNFADGLNKVGSKAPQTHSSRQLALAMEGEVVTRTRKKIQGLNISRIDPKFPEIVSGLLNQTAQEVEAEVQQGYRVKDSKWERKIDGPGGQITWPGLNTGPINTALEADRNWKNWTAGFKQHGSNIVNIPGATFSVEVGNQVVDNQNMPGNKLPPIVISAAARLGMDPFVYFNQAQAAQNGKLLKAPSIISDVKAAADPAIFKLILGKPTVQNSARIMGAANANTFNSGLMKQGQGPVVQQMAQQTQLKPAAVAAFVQSGGQNAGKIFPNFALAMKTYTNPVNAGILAMHQSGTFTPAQLAKKRKELTRAYYAFGGGPEALEGTLRNASAVTTAVTGAGMTVEAFKDYKGRPVVLSKPALSSLQLLIELSNGKVKTSDITSSQRSHAHNKAVKGSDTSYHLVGRALDIGGESLKWMLANLDLVKAAGFGQEAGYENEWHFVYGL